MSEEPPVLRTLASLQAVAKNNWSRVVESAKKRNLLTKELREGWWAPVWEGTKLCVKRHQTPPAGTASGVMTRHGPALGATIIECDGETIAGTDSSVEDSILDEVVHIMVKLAKLLKKHCRQSGWPCVEVDGGATVVAKLRNKLKHDPDAPEIFDAQAANALERSRRGRS